MDRKAVSRILLTLLLADMLALGVNIQSVTSEEQKYEDYPAGTDEMRWSTAILTLDFEPINKAPEKLTTDEGPTIVKRGDPYDPGDGRWVIETEIISMRLEVTIGWLGLITIIESPTRNSNGTVQQQEPGTDFPAKSKFDVFVEVQLPPPYGTLHNNEPMQMQAIIYGLPPWWADYISLEGQTVELYDEHGSLIAFLIHASHNTGRPDDFGGLVVPVDKFGLLVPYIGLASTMVVVTVTTAIYVKRVKGRKKKQ